MTDYESEYREGREVFAEADKLQDFLIAHNYSDVRSKTAAQTYAAFRQKLKTDDRETLEMGLAYLMTERFMAKMETQDTVK